VKRFTAIDKVQQPKVEFTYHAPVAFGPGDAEMQLAARVLADGKASRLYKRLVMDEKLAVDVSAAQQGYPLGGIFQVAVYTRPDADLDRVEKIIDEEIARLVSGGPTAGELDRQRAAIELETLTQLQSIERKADKLNEYEYYWGDPDGFKRDLERFRTATPDQVREWATKTLTPGQRVIVRVLPEEPQREPSARDARPADSTEGTFSLPPVESFTTGDGLKVHVWTRKDLPLVAMRLIAQPGGPLDDPGSPGLASVAAAMMSEGAGDLDALAFENAVQSIGAEFSTTADHHTLDASMTVLTRSFDRGLSLFAEAVRRPRFDAADFGRVKTLTVEELLQRGEVPAAVAAVVGDRLIVGDANPYAWPASGTVQSVEKLELGGVKAAYSRIVRPGASTLLIAGDITAAQARPAIEKAFGGWKAGAESSQARAGTYAMPPRKDMLVAIVDRPGSTQTYIRFVAPGVRYADPTRIDRRLLSTILGGSFTSRLNQNLREDHGYTYGARSRYDMDFNAGTFSAAASVQAEVTGAAISEFLKEFGRLQSGDVTDAEAAKGRETLRNETVRGFQGLGGMLAAASLQLVNGLPFDTVAKDLAEMAGTTAGELNSLAATALPVQTGVLVLVGDKQLILDQIKDLKLPEPVEYDTDGNPVRNSANADK
jgi:zinc protease